MGQTVHLQDVETFLQRKLFRSKLLCQNTRSHCRERFFILVIIKYSYNLTTGCQITGNVQLLDFYYSSFKMVKRDPIPEKAGN